MPELAEVETIRRDVEREFRGRRIKLVEATGIRTLRRHLEPSEFVEAVQGTTLATTGRRGKYLLLLLSSGDAVVIHLGMSGQLLKCRPADPPVRHTHVVLGFTGGPGSRAPGWQLRFVDPRTFGEVFVTKASDLDDVPALAHLGFDPLAPHITWASLAASLGSRRTRLKPLLMDQRFIAGIGNMYADEILWAAGLHPDRNSADLSEAEVRRLYRAMVETLQEAIKYRGSSLADEQYRDLYGEVGQYQHRHQVYGRAGQPCARCRTPIVRVKASGRSSFYCGHCQN